MCYLTPQMNAEIVTIGTELLLGFVVNTDTAYLGRALAGLGIGCYRQVTVGDNPERLSEAIRTALSRADLVITCGGLGPTVDDITLETIARVTGKRLVLRPEIARKIRARFARPEIPRLGRVRLRRRMPPSNLRQALIPEGAVVFPNDVGTAPGFLLFVKRGQALFDEKSQKVPDPILVALPGPPRELIPMVERFLIPRLRRLTGKAAIVSRTLKLTGLTESEVDAQVRDLLALQGKVTVGIYAHPSQVDLRITAKAESASAAGAAIRQVESKIRRRFGQKIFGADEQTLEGAVGHLLLARKQTLAVAESCTGGLLGHRITEVPGSSAYFRGGLIAYANELKTAGLGVTKSLLRKHGAVSAPVAAAMARGIRSFAGADLGLAVTGIAGPTGGTKKKPVGLVYIALSTPQGTQTFRHRFSGDRSTIKFKASQAALDLVRHYCLASR